jgi:hypothetical protein
MVRQKNLRDVSILYLAKTKKPAGIIRAAKSKAITRPSRTARSTGDVTHVRHMACWSKSDVSKA